MCFLVKCPDHGLFQALSGTLKPISELSLSLSLTDYLAITLVQVLTVEPALLSSLTHLPICQHLPSSPLTLTAGGQVQNTEQELFTK